MKKPLLFLFALLLILFVIGAVQIYANRKAEENLQELISRFGVEGSVRYEELSYSLLSGVTEIRGLSVASPEGTTSVDRVVITKMNRSDLEFSAVGISSDTPDFRGFSERLRELGYETVKMNAHVSLSLYDDRKELVVRRFAVTVPDAFSVGFRLHVDRIDSSLIAALRTAEEDEETVEELSERLGRVRIRSFEFSIEDLGIRVRMLEREASLGGREPEEILSTIREGLEGSLRNDPLFREELFGALESFLLKGGTLRFRADPVPPVDFQTLVLLALFAVQSGEYSEFVYRLNVKVRHLPQPSSRSYRLRPLWGEPSPRRVSRSYR